MEEKTYTVMALAETLGAGRTTVYDWLARYTQYIDFKMVGRRRVYTEATLAVLREISELRNKGLAGPEIETELAKTHAVRPVAEDPLFAAMGEEMPKQNETEKSASAPVPVPADEFAMIAKQQSDELARAEGEQSRTQGLARLRIRLRASRRSDRARSSLLPASDPHRPRKPRRRCSAERGDSGSQRQNRQTHRIGGKYAERHLRTEKRPRLAEERVRSSEVAALKDNFAKEKKEQLQRMEQLAAEKNREIEQLKKQNADSAQKIKELEQNVKK